MSSFKKSATIANNAILQKHGAIQNDNDSIDYCGWRFTTNHGPILNAEQLKNLTIKLGHICGVESDGEIIEFQGAKMHLPSMIFGSDFLVIKQIDSNFDVSFTAIDALEGWVVQHIPFTSPEDGIDEYTVPKLHIIQVPFSTSWTRLSSLGVTDEGHQLAQLSYWDWTYSSDYCCTISTMSKEENFVEMNERERCTVTLARNLSLNTNPKRNIPVETRNYVWRRCGPGGIDFSLLQQRDDILLYDEMILYQDDLEDCGDVKYDIKVRVMPTCWYVLSRLYVRVDGTELLLRESRIFHKFRTNAVYLDVTWRQATYASIENHPNFTPGITLDANLLVQSGLVPEVWTAAGTIHKHYMLNLG